MKNELLDGTTYYERVASDILPFTDRAEFELSDSLQSVLKFLSQNEDVVGTSEYKVFKIQLEREINQAFDNNQPEALLSVHTIMYTIYEVMFMNPVANPVKHLSSLWFQDVKLSIEKRWIRYEIDSIKELVPEYDQIKNFDSFRDFLVKTSQDTDPVNKVITDFLRQDATHSQMERFVRIDQHLNHRFYDAIALTLPHFSESTKAELSQHYWEEAGEGNYKQSHTYQFTKILDHLQIEVSPTPVWNDWRAFAGFNIYFLFGNNREHYFKAIGSLGMPELFDVDRDSELVEGLRRLGYDVETHFNYYIAHVEMDSEHGDEWLDHIIAKMINQEPKSMREIAIGALIRMKYMRLFNRYLCLAFDIQLPN